MPGKCGLQPPQVEKEGPATDLPPDWKGVRGVASGIGIMSMLAGARR